MESIHSVGGYPSINRLTMPMLDVLCRDAAQLRIVEQHLLNGCRVIDAGINTPGGLEAGRRIAELCMGGLGRITLNGDGKIGRWPVSINVHSCDPVLACLGSQYAGWSLAYGEGKEAFHALASGPGRVLAGKEELFNQLAYCDRSDTTFLVLEVDRLPPTGLSEKIARDCAIDVSGLTLILTPNHSLAGTTQVVARVLEVAMHKAHALGFPLHDIIDGAGSAPLSPPSPDFVTGMGRTNDAILYGGHVHLYVKGSDQAARDLAERLPSASSRDYGKPFAEVFEEYNHDFFAIDPMLFSPAQVTVSSLESGNTFHAGVVDEQILNHSFGAH
ncbi:MAG TPA: methenyltetrahydromethanopterin cyclohydrolase [Gammaproteobacteria bacterium]|nr:methenyltetrahydromethanopterin cyclohydrolase [Gammaproteobacteria bacterium]